MKEAGDAAKGTDIAYKEYQDDFENMDPNEERAFWRKESMPRLGVAPPAGRPMWQLCAVLTVSAILLLALIITVSVSNVKVDRKFTALEKTVANLSASVASITSKMADTKHSDNLNREINAVKTSLKNTERVLTSVMTGMDALEPLKRTVSELKCSLEKFIKNVTTEGCCPHDWVWYSSACFFFSDEGMAWESARDHCSSFGASLVIMKDDAKWNFVAKRTKPLYYWIGLTDERTGEWEWVDGTPYYMNRRQWKPGQPDDWTAHGLGGGEDCAHLHDDGRLNDDHCSRQYRFVCEKPVESTSG
ncbi:asialoglycoprotein receptor 1 [Megalops cyprinoides]|uniref:asialoglycoprotein receptor 1 n=1 Tax=Megalops cyprinoides TaxID=118141 RepID=UPI001864003F|nr:asialoglycoprotein receptor 1 [Megalops cyprinoides]